MFINGNSFCYLLTQEKQLACLEGIRRHLKPNGRAYIYIVPFSSKLNADFKVRRTFPRKGGGKLVEDHSATVDYDRHLFDFHVIWRVGGKVYRDTTRTRIMTVPEFALLIRLAGLRVGRSWGDYRLRMPARPRGRIYELTR